MGDDTPPGGTHLVGVAGSCSVCERRPSPPQPWAGITKPELLAQHVRTKSLQSCLTLCDSRDCSPPGSSVHGILQARILEWVAISFSNARLLGRKVMTKLDSIIKSRGITSPTKVRLVKAMVFPVVMYVCESWTVKKAERRRIDAFELWCWRRLLRVLWITRRSNQSILKISP